MQSTDFMEMESALAGWDHQYQQTETGDFYGELLLSHTDSLQIFKNLWQRRIHYRGAAPKGTVALAVTMNCSGQAFWNGVSVSADDVILQRAGVDADYISGSIWDSVVFAIPEADLMRRIANFTQKDPEDSLRALEVVQLTPQHAAQIRRYARNYLGTLKHCFANPELATKLQEMDEPMCIKLAQLIAHSLTDSAERHGSAQRQKLIQKIKNFDDEHSFQPVNIETLHELAGLSSRTLRRIFKDQTGMSPLHYLKCRRLNHVHRRLRESSPDSTLVKQVAYDFGFRHLGQFSHDYRELFGELPSHTLSKAGRINTVRQESV